MSSKKSSSPSRPAAKAAPNGAPQQPSRPAAAAPVRKWSLSAFLSKPAVVYAVTFVALWFFCQMVYGDVFARAAVRRLELTASLELARGALRQLAGDELSKAAGRAPRV